MRKLLFALAASLPFSCPAFAGNDQSDIVALEKTLWQAEVDKDVDAYAEHMMADVVQITGAGLVQGREEAAKDATSCDLRSFELHDIKMHRLTDDVVALHYTATIDGDCHGKRMPPKVLATAVWQRVDGQWQNSIYHSTQMP